MLQINMADVMNVIGSLTPYLIAIGVLFALALIITFAVNKKTVKDVATRKIVHSESWLVALVGIVVAVSMMLTGPLSTLLNNATITKYTLSDATVSKANELAKDVQSEAVTLLKNDDSNLPLSGKKVNVFGWGSTNPVYGGTGSGSMSKQYKTVSLLDGMKQAGLKTNTELSKLYTDYREDRPEVGMFAQDWTLPEVPAKQYSDKLVSDASNLDGFELTREIIRVYVDTVAAEPEIYPFVFANSSASKSKAIADSEKIIARMLAVVLRRRMAHAGMDTGGVDAFAFHTVGGVQLATHSWMSNRRMTAEQLIDYLTLLSWSALRGIVEVGGSLAQFNSQPHPSPVLPPQLLD